MHVHLHSSLQHFNHGDELVDISLCTAGELLHAVVMSQPTLKPVLLDLQGEPQAFINVYINGQPVDRLNREHPLNDSDCIEIMSALVGG